MTCIDQPRKQPKAIALERQTYVISGKRHPVIASPCTKSNDMSGHLGFLFFMFLYFLQ